MHTIEKSRKRPRSWQDLMEEINPKHDILHTLGQAPSAPYTFTYDYTDMSYTYNAIEDSPINDLKLNFTMDKNGYMEFKGISKDEDSDDDNKRNL